jgi:hypothetical protein
VATKFNIPSRFRAVNPLADHESLAHLSTFILPRSLFVCITPCWSHRLSYEIYHSSACACQLGFNQLPMGPFFLDKLRTCQPVSSVAECANISALTYLLPIGDLDNLDPDSTCMWLFTIWWDEWWSHIFNRRCIIYLSPMDLEDLSDEVWSWPIFLFIALILSQLSTNHFLLLSLQLHDTDAHSLSSSNQLIYYKQRRMYVQPYRVGIITLII